MTWKLRPYRRKDPKSGQLRENGWEVDIVLKLPDGKVLRERVRAPVSSRSGAKYWAEQREAELLRNGRKKEEPPVPTMDEFFPRFIEGYAKANRQKPSSIESKESIYRHHLKPLFGNRRLNEITELDVQKLKAKLSHLNAKTVNNVLCSLTKMLKLAVKWRLIPHLPVQVEFLKIDEPLVAFYEFEDYVRLLEGAAKVGTAAQVAVLLGGDAGLRSGEMLSLDWTEVDFRRNQLVVSKADWKGHLDITPKGGRSRVIPMTSRLRAALSRQPHHLNATRVLCEPDGKPMSEQNLRTLIANAQKRAGLRANGNKHILRHTFCSHLAMRGATMLAIKELAGHRSLRTTMRYMHLSPSHKEGAIRLLEGAPPAEKFGEILETERV